MSEKSFRHTKKSSSSKKSILNKPNGYRMIYKTKSGFLDTDSITQSRLITQRKMNATETSFCTERQNNITGLQNSFRSSTTKINPKSSESLVDENGHQTEHLPRMDNTALRQMPYEIQEQNWSELSIGEVEKKVDDLIEIKLERAAERSTQQNKQPDQIDSKINKIVQYLQREEKSPENLKLTNRKIEILEKILAQNLIQSELAKKYYFKKINTRKAKIPNLSKYKTNLSELKQQTKKLMHRNPPTSIHFQSTSQINYRPPDKSAYPSSKIKSKYIFDNQPLPRSSYGRDYLDYGSLPKYIHKEDKSPQLPSCSTGKRNSSYQDDFTVKKIERINFKQLDCYQDKFRNLKIPLIDSKSYRVATEKSPQIPIYRTIQNPQTTRQKQRHKSEVGQNHYINLLSTQNRLKYRGEDNGIKSAIKDRKLMNFKYAYKAVVHA